MFKIIRVVTLLFIFIAIAFYTKTQKLSSRSWSVPLQVVIYPMNGDGSPLVERYINQLNTSDYQEIDQFFHDEAEHYSLSIQYPTSTHLGEIITNHPPLAPRPDAGLAKIAWWSIKLRYWAFRHTPDDDSNFNRIRAFVYYHTPEKNKRLKHSLGLDKGLLVIAHTFASVKLEPQNNIVLAHELLHTVGASDKYDSNAQPVYPDGYANPDKSPLFPQLMAEIMAAVIPTSQINSEMAESLKYCVIGEKTAREINWVKDSPD